jgi:hypothetical protein
MSISILENPDGGACDFLLVSSKSDLQDSPYISETLSNLNQSLVHLSGNGDRDSTEVGLRHRFNCQ